MDGVLFPFFCASRRRDVTVQQSQYNAGCFVQQEKMHGKVLFDVTQLEDFFTQLDLPDTGVNKSNVRWKSKHADVVIVHLSHDALKK